VNGYVQTISKKRYVAQQLIGPLELWIIGSRKESREKKKPLAALGIDPDDQRGKENIGWSDCGYVGTSSPFGLLNGLCALNMVAGWDLMTLRADILATDGGNAPATGQSHDLGTH
jgi:hypothetical protein